MARRISKDPDTRKREIAAAAQALFVEKGFAETRISDIARRIGVSQGVFYYYFGSKEDVVDAIVAGYMSELIAASEQAAAGVSEPLARLAALAEAQQRINAQVNAGIHAIKGVDIHERIIRALVRDYVPLMQEALDGHGANADTRYWIEAFVVAGNVLFDPGLFRWSDEEHEARVTYLIGLMEKTRNLPAGSLGFYRGLMRAPSTQTDESVTAGDALPTSAL
ncbi:MAG: TetR/AcrR family transcriptional regulator [Alphaproteobacteria bacterium]|nr:TetR/AcrR family transcriptional regulator [Alphaproteobacteria bacterium]